MKFALVLFAITLPVLSFANSKADYVCEVQSIRNSLIQKVYDYTIDIDYTIQDPSLDSTWLIQGDKFEVSMDNSIIDMNFEVRENLCSGPTKTIKSKRLYRTKSKAVKYESNEQIDGTNVNLKIDGDKMSGKMRLMTMGEFSSEECGVDLHPNVILKFSCVKK